MTFTHSNSLRQRLKFVTLTGIDEGVPFDALYEMARRHPYVEFGVLYSNSQQGMARYPTMAWLDSLAGQLQAKPGLQLSLHVCGSAIFNLLSDEGHVSDLARAFPRLQLNFICRGHPIRQLKELLGRFPKKTIITQHNRSNEMLWHQLTDKPNHAVLFDSSGGRGIEPEQWPAPLIFTPKVFLSKDKSPLCGYAGGLGPDNIAGHLRQIDQLANGASFWLDMEGKLRNANDRFDLVIAQRCLDAVESVLTQDAAHEAADGEMAPLMEFDNSWSAA